MKKGFSFGAVIKEMRIKSWLKNIFVLSPIVFSLELFDLKKLSNAIILSIAFCLVSSSIYVVNDISDVEKDRNHKEKKNRPIAARELSIPGAWVLFSILIVVGLGLSALISPIAFSFLFIYVLINLLYSKWLKRIVIVDCFCIAAGFVLRVMVGGTIVSAGISHWMFLTVVALSLFMAFGKRRGEMCSYLGQETRIVLDEYDKSFLDGAVFMCASLSMVFYSLWSISQESNLVYTVPIVLFIVIRYLLMVFKGKGEADPTTLVLSDKPLWVSCGICGVMMIVMLYGKQIAEFFVNIW